MNPEDVQRDIEILVEAIKSGGEQSSGESTATDVPVKYSHMITFGKVYELTVDTLEALNGTLRAAKREKKIWFKKQMLLKGADDNQIIYLIED